jgi:hypothetical protein
MRQFTLQELNFSHRRGRMRDKYLQDDRDRLNEPRTMHEYDGLNETEYVRTLVSVLTSKKTGSAD